MLAESNSEIPNQFNPELAAYQKLRDLRGALSTKYNFHITSVGFKEIDCIGLIRNAKDLSDLKTIKDAIFEAFRADTISFLDFIEISLLIIGKRMQFEFPNSKYLDVLVNKLSEEQDQDVILKLINSGYHGEDKRNRYDDLKMLMTVKPAIYEYVGGSIPSPIRTEFQNSVQLDWQIIDVEEMLNAEHNRDLRAASYLIKLGSATVSFILDSVEWYLKPEPRRHMVMPDDKLIEEEKFWNTVFGKIFYGLGYYIRIYLAVRAIFTDKYEDKTIAKEAEKYWRALWSIVIAPMDEDAQELKAASLQQIVSGQVNMIDPIEEQELRRGIMHELVNLNFEDASKLLTDLILTLKESKDGNKKWRVAQPWVSREFDPTPRSKSKLALARLLEVYRGLVDAEEESVTLSSSPDTADESSQPVPIEETALADNNFSLEVSSDVQTIEPTQSPAELYPDESGESRLSREYWEARVNRMFIPYHYFEPGTHLRPSVGQTEVIHSEHTHMLTTNQVLDLDSLYKELRNYIKAEGKNPILWGFVSALYQKTTEIQNALKRSNTDQGAEDKSELVGFLLPELEGVRKAAYRYHASVTNKPCLYLSDEEMRYQLIQSLDIYEKGENIPVYSRQENGQLETLMHKIIYLLTQAYDETFKELSYQHRSGLETWKVDLLPWIYALTEGVRKAANIIKKDFHQLSNLVAIKVADLGEQDFNHEGLGWNRKKLVIEQRDGEKIVFGIRALEIFIDVVLSRETGLETNPEVELRLRSLTNEIRELAYKLQTYRKERKHLEGTPRSIRSSIAFKEIELHAKQYSRLMVSNPYSRREYYELIRDGGHIMNPIIMNDFVKQIAATVGVFMEKNQDYAHLITEELVVQLLIEEIFLKEEAKVEVKKDPFATEKVFYKGGYHRVDHFNLRIIGGFVSTAEYNSISIRSTKYNSESLVVNMYLPLNQLKKIVQDFIERRVDDERKREMLHECIDILNNKATAILRVIAAAGDVGMRKNLDPDILEALWSDLMQLQEVGHEYSFKRARTYHTIRSEDPTQQAQITAVIETVFRKFETDDWVNVFKLTNDPLHNLIRKIGTILDEEVEAVVNQLKFRFDLAGSQVPKVEIYAWFQATLIEMARTLSIKEKSTREENLIDFLNSLFRLGFYSNGIQWKDNKFQISRYALMRSENPGTQAIEAFVNEAKGKYSFESLITSEQNFYSYGKSPTYNNFIELENLTNSIRYLVLNLYKEVGMPSLVGKRQALAAFREAFKELGGKRYDNVQVGIIQDELRIFRMYNSDGDGGEITQAQAANIFDLLIEVVKEWKQISDPMHQLFDTEDLAILLFEEIFSNKARSAGWEA